MSSASGILRTAITGLNTSQSALLTTAANIANVNTDGYVRQEVVQKTVVVGNQTAGVAIATVRRVIDKFLRNELRLVSSAADQFGLQAEFHDRLQSLLGRPDLNTSLSGRVDALFAGLANLTIDPASQVRRVGALNDMAAFGDEVSRLAVQVQRLRSDADKRIVDNIGVVNRTIERVWELNNVIAAQVVAGRQPVGLDEQRDRALGELAKFIDVRITNKDFGAIKVTTGENMVLVDEGFVELRYEARGSVNSATRFAQIQAHKVDPFSKAVDPDSVAFDPGIDGGAFRGLLDMRNSVLPKIARELGEFAGRAVDELNRVHNNNVAFPPPSRMVGRNTGLTVNDRHQFTGKATFVVFNPDLSIRRVRTIDLANTGVTVGNLVVAVNDQLAGLARLTDTDGAQFTDGTMVFEALEPGLSVAILQDENDPSQRAGRGFSQFFGLNDVMRADKPAHFDTGFTGPEAHNFETRGEVDLQFVGPNGEVASAFVLSTNPPSTGSPNFQYFIDSLNDSRNLGKAVTFALDQNGALTWTPLPGFEGYNVVVRGDTSRRMGSGVSFSQLFGLGDFQRMNRAVDVGVLPSIRTDTSRLALGKVNLKAAAGTPAVTSGDAAGALAFQALETTAVNFKKAGHLSAAQDTLAAYGAGILANAGVLAANASARAEDRSLLRIELEKKSTDISGVNLDEELSNMIIFQNAYNASARVIATAQELFDTLLELTG